MSQGDDSRSFSALLSNLLLSLEEISSLAKDSQIEREAMSEFSLFVERIAPILTDLKEIEAAETAPIRKAIESLDAEINRSRDLLKNSNSRCSLRQIEEAVHDLGRCLGLVLQASLDVAVEIQESIGALHKEMIGVTFISDASAGSSNRHEIEEFIQNVDEGGKEDLIVLDADDLALHLKKGSDEEFGDALSELSKLMREGLVENEWIIDKGIVQILLNRLSSSKHDGRLAIILILRSLASKSDEIKV